MQSWTASTVGNVLVELFCQFAEPGLLLLARQTDQALECFLPFLAFVFGPLVGSSTVRSRSPLQGAGRCRTASSWRKQREQKREQERADRHACSGQPPPACCAICNSSFQLALSRLLKPGGCGGFRSLMIQTLSAAHRASLRRIVENSGSSAYAKSSAFSSGFLGHILRIILRLAAITSSRMVRGMRSRSALRSIHSRHSPGARLLRGEIARVD